MSDLSCSDVEARFIDALDARLDSAESVRLHTHLERCAACRERAALWSRLVPEMRAAVPPAPGAMASRRMLIEIERGLAAERTAPPAPARRWRWAPAFALVAAAAAFALWLRPNAHSPVAPVAPMGYAALASVRGAVTVGERATASPARVATGAPIALAADAALVLAVDSGAIVNVDGPGQLKLEGSARDVAIRLGLGKLSAAVEHRRAEQTFVVITDDLRVEVRGTKFSVDATPAGTLVEVTEGQVAVRFADGHSTLVSAGERAATFDLDAPPEAAPEPAVSPRAPPAAATTCAEVARSCQSTAGAVRASMRGGSSDRALHLLADARRELRVAGPRCEGSTAACEDELGYLNAEALNQAGRLDDAAAAYRALDRRGAPPAMRQNVLYATAQIERRQGRPAAAAATFERALAAAPRGALREDALVGAMESAHAAGDEARARALAARYLKEFPGGLGAVAAHRFAGDGAP
ncbi:MAG TPA: FecR domain-containing protein [Polyangia bacterium]|nr:FecR domain-containing protein [Polyangia bacterium]